jgi:predicted ATPase
VLSTLAHALGLREGAGQSLLARLQTHLRSKRLLLVLDNFEHVVPATPQLTELLAGTLYVTLLVTSRAALLVRGEQEYPIAPLVFPDTERVHNQEQLLRYEAVQLFVERMHAVRPTARLSDESAVAIADICRRLDGLPLAIELAAARTRVLTPQALLARLGRRLPLLTSPARDVPERHRTLRATIDWSYDLLEREEQRLFRWLAVFVGGCTLEAAEAVCNPKGDLDVLDGMTSLVSNSLLRQEEAHGELRFSMLETVREYVLERLEQSGEQEVARRRHAQYYADKLLHEAGRKVFSPEATRWLDWFERERDNIRAVLTWSQTTPEGLALGPPLMSNLIWFWYRRGYFSEGCEWSERVLASPVAAESNAARAMALLASGAMAMWQGDLRTALAQTEERLTIVRHEEDELALARTLMFLGVIWCNMGNDRAAYALLKEAQLLFAHLDDTYFYAITLVHLANAALGMGNLAEAREWLATATRLSREIGEHWLLAFVLNNLGEVARVQGDYQEAARSYTESEALLRATGDQGDRARFIHSLGYVAQHAGDYAQAEAHFRASLAMFRKLGNTRGMAECLAGLAGLRAIREEPQKAALLLGAAQAALTATGAAWWPADRGEYERNLARIQAALAADACAAAWAQGQAMSLEQALELALRDE